MFALSAETTDLTHARNCCSGKRASGDARKGGGGDQAQVAFVNFGLQRGNKIYNILALTVALFSAERFFAAGDAIDAVVSRRRRHRAAHASVAL